MTHYFSTKKVCDEYSIKKIRAFVRAFVVFSFFYKNVSC